MTASSSSCKPPTTPAPRPSSAHSSPPSSSRSTNAPRRSSTNTTRASPRRRPPKSPRIPPIPSNPRSLSSRRIPKIPSSPRNRRNRRSPMARSRKIPRSRTRAVRNPKSPAAATAIPTSICRKSRPLRGPANLAPDAPGIREAGARKDRPQGCARKSECPKLSRAKQVFRISASLGLGFQPAARSRDLLLLPFLVS